MRSELHQLYIQALEVFSVQGGDAQAVNLGAALVLWFGRSRGRLRLMAMVEYFANTPTCSFGDFACSLGGTDANVFAGDDCTLSDIAGGVDGVEGDEIARTLPDTLGRCSGAFGGAFANVSGAAADVAAGAALLGLGGWLGCFGGLRGLSVLAGGVLTTEGEG
jgi:hypothetical protein